MSRGENLKWCEWPANDPLMIKYHHEEWGMPLHDDKKLFEFLVLESFQAGLSWRTVLHKRENFRKSFAGFDVVKVSKFDQKKVKALVQNKGIIRNRLKIEATINNANRFLEVQQEFGSFDKYVWQFTGGKTIVNKFKSIKELPTKTAFSDAMSNDMGKRGFKFRGSTICYAFMQAIGMVNDHTVDCFRYKELQ
ncbi:MAG: DNA-3-methyladenine glycosylase I [Flavobacteriales bacterium]|nr:DNA-3-methyladenine glycosylase I [Bacteroidales bacterium AH-315-I05]PCJ85848.1 MAG: DNA-3-methyladenine glycosylase I [Flavobacteriales bacterium]